MANFTLSQSPKTDSVNAWFFEEIEYCGERNNIDMRNDGTCYNLDDIRMANRVSSIALFGKHWIYFDYQYCIYLFDEDNCVGQNIKLDNETFCFYDLSVCEKNMNKITVLN